MNEQVFVISPSLHPMLYDIILSKKGAHAIQQKDSKFVGRTNYSIIGRAERFCQDNRSILKHGFPEWTKNPTYRAVLSKRFGGFTVDHHFLIYPDMDFYQDGTREFEDRRLEHFEIIRDMLMQEHCSFTIIKGDDKFQQIVDKVREMMTTTFTGLPRGFDKF